MRRNIFVAGPHPLKTAIDTLKVWQTYEGTYLEDEAVRVDKIIAWQFVLYSSNPLGGMHVLVLEVEVTPMFEITPQEWEDIKKP